MNEKSAAGRARCLAELAEILTHLKSAAADLGDDVSPEERAELMRAIAACERELRELGEADREVRAPSIAPFWRKRSDRDDR